MPKILTGKVHKCLIAIALLWAVPDLADSLCQNQVSALAQNTHSFDALINDYAQLILSAEDTPAESPESVVIKTALEESSAKLTSLIPLEEQESAKLKIAQKLKELRRQKNGELDEATLQEKEARAQEDDAFKLRFSPQGLVINPHNFRMSQGQLSPEGRYFFLSVPKSDNLFQVTLYSLEEGREVFSREVKTYDAPEVEFYKHDKIVKFEHFRYRYYHSSGPIGENFDFRNTEFINTQTGSTIFKQRDLEMGSNTRTNGNHMEISPDGDKILIKKKRKIKIINLNDKSESKMSVPDNHWVAAHFDWTGENVLTQITIDRPKFDYFFQSKNIRTGALNFKLKGKPHFIKGNSRYLLQSARPDEKINQSFLLDSETGRLIRTFDEMDLRLDRAVVSEDNKLIFIPQEDLHKGFIYSTTDQGPGAKLELPGSQFFDGRFFDNNQKFAQIIYSKFYAWDATTGIPLPIDLPLTSMHTFGIDSRGNLIGAPVTDAARDPNAYQSLKLWDRLGGEKK